MRGNHHDFKALVDQRFTQIIGAQWPTRCRRIEVLMKDKHFHAAKKRKLWYLYRTIAFWKRKFLRRTQD